MRIPISAEKAKEIEAYAAKIEELLQTVRTLDDAAIPDSVKNLSLGELEGTPVRVKTCLTTLGFVLYGNWCTSTWRNAGNIGVGFSPASTGWQNSCMQLKMAAT